MTNPLLALVKMWRALRDPYRPELHYMRGPGPRCLVKASEGVSSSAISAGTGRLSGSR